MTALIPQESFNDTTATSSQGHHTIFGPKSQGKFLASLQLFGNVRLACKTACVSAQTAYRARRSSPGFSRAWDAALLAARAHAEATLADRAIHGVEEAVFYHGEEVARRRRYDSRLLLAHLARLDRLAEREDIAAALPLLDDQIDALARGEAIADPVPHEAHENFSQDPVPCVPSCRVSHGGEGVAPTAIGEAVGCQASPSSSEAVGQQACPDCGGACTTPGASLGAGDCQWLENRLSRMDAARPADTDPPEEPDEALKEALAWEQEQAVLMASGDKGEVEHAQLLGFEGGVARWWTLTGMRDLRARLARSGQGDVGDGDAPEAGGGAGGRPHEH